MCFCVEGPELNRKSQRFIYFFPGLLRYLGPILDAEVVRLDLRRGGVLYSKYVDEEQ